MIADVPSHGMMAECPSCHHKFWAEYPWRVFERLGAKLLGGKVMPRGQRGYDVAQSPELPGLYFQIKHSNPIKPTGQRWLFTVKEYNHHEQFMCDFFVLFGVHASGSHEVFLMSRADLIRIGGSKDPWAKARLSAFTTKFKPGGTYNWFWEYFVPDPVKNLVEYVKTYADRHHVIVQREFEPEIDPQPIFFDDAE